MIVVKRAGTDKDPGTWWRTLSKDDGTRTVWVRCSNGHYATLSDHEIAADGTVSPSVVCPETGCDFHEMLQLEGWEP